MSSYTNTSVYLASIKFYDHIAKLCRNKIADPLFYALETQAITLTTDIALAIDQENKEEQNAALTKSTQNFKLIRQYIDLAKHRKSISTNEIDMLEEEIRIMQSRIDFFINNRPTILILSSIMGQGHLSAARAIKEGLESLYGKDYNIVIIDFVEKIGAFLNKATLKTYEGSTKYLPNAYKFFFESTDSKWPVKFLNLVNYPLNASKIKKLFSSYNPSITISTFPVWDYLASLVIKKSSSPKFLSLITDSISIHNCWLSGSPDFHIVANEETAISVQKLGAKPEKIKNLGFPVKLSFMKATNRNEFLNSIHLDSKKFTALLIPTAGTPLSTLKKVKEIKTNLPDINLIIICGRDKELLPKLNKKFKNDPNIRIIGWTNQMPDFIKSADVVITKAGGATVMECIAAKKAMIITHIIPGQEMGNAELIKKHNLGIIPKEANMTLTECIDFIRKHKHAFDRNLNKISRPDAALNIAKFIHSQLETNE